MENGGPDHGASVSLGGVEMKHVPIEEKTKEPTQEEKDLAEAAGFNFVQFENLKGHIQVFPIDNISLSEYERVQKGHPDSGEYGVHGGNSDWQDISYLTWEAIRGLLHAARGIAIIQVEEVEGGD